MGMQTILWRAIKVGSHSLEVHRVSLVQPYSSTWHFKIQVENHHTYPMKILEWMGLDGSDSRKPLLYMLWKGNPITFPTWTIEKSIQMPVKGKSFVWFWILCCLLEGWEAIACTSKQVIAKDHRSITTIYTAVEYLFSTYGNLRSWLLHF